MTTYVTGRPLWLKRIALIILFTVATDAAAAAQALRPATPDPGAILTPGLTAWITDSGGREEKTRVIGVSGDVLTTTSPGGVRRLLTADVRRVRVRQSDPVINGALIGAGAAIASGLLLCKLTEPWENCRDDVGPMVRIGAIGAGIGIGIDALIRGRKTIYEARPGSARLQALPLVGRHAGGLQIAVSF